ncbi:MAG: hypothetical protein NPIRA05_02110 [Nitrospirales bacterium]|nr:MAG: hypothetical protein NPIRA05_02110 [Nitrospirales bacterium]
MSEWTDGYCFEHYADGRDPCDGKPFSSLWSTPLVRLAWLGDLCEDIVKIISFEGSVFVPF